MVKREGYLCKHYEKIEVTTKTGKEYSYKLCKFDKVGCKNMFEKDCYERLDIIEV